MDKHYEVRWKTLPEIISSWVDPYFNIDGKRVLDFGCGDGATALGFAMNFTPKEVLGIEVQDEELANFIPRAKSNLGLSILPSNFGLSRISPGQSLDAFGKFDLIYAWSVFEHVDQGLIPDALETIKNALNPSGLVFIQIAPLYFSAFGSHLGEFVKAPWAHLLMQDDRLLQKLEAECENKSKYEELVNCYRTLNKITAQGLIDAVSNAGLEILRDYRTQVDSVIPDNSILTIYNRDVLMTEQIVILARLRN